MQYLTTLLRPDPRGRRKFLVFSDGVFEVGGDTMTYTEYVTAWGHSERVEVTVGGVSLDDLAQAGQPSGA